MSNKLNILILGAGMYVTGRGTKTDGTVIPAILEYSRQHKENIEKIIIITHTQKSVAFVRRYINKVIKLSSIDFKSTLKIITTKNDLETKRIIKTNKLNTAIIATPDHLHFSHAKICISLGMYILVMKPLTPTLKEAKHLYKIAKQNNVFNVVEFHKRKDRANLILKRELNTKSLGQLLYSIVEYSQRKEVPTKFFQKWNEKTTILQYLGVHYIDLMFYLTKAKPISVMATAQNGWLRENGIKNYDAIQCHIQWQTGIKQTFTQSLFVNWIDPNNSSAASNQKIKLIGTKGRIESNQKSRGVLINTDKYGIEEPNPDFSMAYQDDKNSITWKGYGIENISSFLNGSYKIINNLITLQELNLSHSTFKDALVSTAIIEAAHKSLKSGSKWIKMK